MVQLVGKDVGTIGYGLMGTLLPFYNASSTSKSKYSSV
jgi:hypothetical protein